MTTPIVAPTSSGALTNTLYETFHIAYLTIDPVHIGAGGHRLGRVDMTIIREPGTRLPKIPGTSLSGAARSYSALLYGKPEAAGQQKKLQARSTDCPILHTYGTATDDNQGSAGTVSVCDARIFLFPVATSLGPVWITTSELLKEAGFVLHTLEPSSDSEIKTTLDAVVGSPLNLGWILFHNIQAGTLGDASPGSIGHGLLGDTSIGEAISRRIVAVHPSVFAAIVNSNVEVRTSVSIDPEKGIAEDGALFSYEAIPRATILMGDVIEDDYRVPKFRSVDHQFKRAATDADQDEENKGAELATLWTRPVDVVKAGMSLMEVLGVGGMGTRGFGRVRAIWP